MRLSINIDHVATLRQARGGIEPNPTQAALICIEAGADGIVCHLREDRRHINDNDIWQLRKTIPSRLDLEMAATSEIIGIALEVVPDLVTLVPEKRQELTTEGGLDVLAEREHLKETIDRFHSLAIPVSLFIEPDRAQIDAAKSVGADMVELHTGHYADACSPAEIEKRLSEIRDAAYFAHGLGLIVNAGHGLNYQNTASIAAIDSIHELSIGHAIITRAVFVGIREAVREMRKIVRKEL